MNPQVRGHVLAKVMRSSLSVRELDEVLRWVVGSGQRIAQCEHCRIPRLAHERRAVLCRMPPTRGAGDVNHDVLLDSVCVRVCQQYASLFWSDWIAGLAIAGEAVDQEPHLGRCVVIGRSRVRLDSGATLTPPSAKKGGPFVLDRPSAEVVPSELSECRLYVVEN